jgi:hypothetical protein
MFLTPSAFSLHLPNWDTVSCASSTTSPRWTISTQRRLPQVRALGPAAGHTARNTITASLWYWRQMRGSMLARVSRADKQQLGTIPFRSVKSRPSPSGSPKGKSVDRPKKSAFSAAPKAQQKDSTEASRQGSSCPQSPPPQLPAPSRVRQGADTQRQAAASKVSTILSTSCDLVGPPR